MHHGPSVRGPDGCSSSGSREKAPAPALISPTARSTPARDPPVFSPSSLVDISARDCGDDRAAGSPLDDDTSPSNRDGRLPPSRIAARRAAEGPLAFAEGGHGRAGVFLLVLVCSPASFPGSSRSTRWTATSPPALRPGDEADAGDGEGPRRLSASRTRRATRSRWGIYWMQAAGGCVRRRRAVSRARETPVQ